MEHLNSQDLESEEATHQLAIQYILTYKDVALDEMQKTGIPVSIKLAQGILESNFGRSPLAILANNHFGAKCHNTWTGASILYDDDEANECFRKYDSAIQSYIDHSKVLAKDRYQFLFQLDKKDYVSWCKGLKKAGYATDPNYAQKLIAIIERYNLNIYDEQPELLAQADYNVYHKSQNYNYNPLKTIPNIVVESPNSPKSIKKKNHKPANKEITKIKVSKYRGYKYVKYDVEASPQKIAELYNIHSDQLCKYNGLQLNENFKASQLIFLEKLGNKAPKKIKEYIVMEGDRIEAIAKKFAMDPSFLRTLNVLPNQTQPKPNTIINLVDKKNFPDPFFSSEKEYVQSLKPAGSASLTQDNSTTAANMETAQMDRLIHPKLPKDAVIVDSFEVLEEVSGNLYVSNSDANFAPEPVLTLANTIKPQQAQQPQQQTTPTKQNQNAKPKPKEKQAAQDQEKPTIFDMPEFELISKPSTTATGVELIVIPVSPDSTSNELIAQPAPPSYHKVIAGETLFRIASKYGLTVDELKALNKMNDNKIVIGQKLILKP